MKHSYLIVAHNNFRVLERLLMLIDDERNDIYIHFDKKTQFVDEERFSQLVKRAGLYFVKKRIDVCWGDVSQIEVEQLLFREAAATREYSYYHLLSGVDLPLKSQDYLHDFFNKFQGCEFIGITDVDKSAYEDRVRHFHLFVKRIKIGDNWFVRKIRKYALKLQDLIGYDRVGNDLGQLKKGSNWVSLTDGAVRYLLAKTEQHIRRYRYSYCCDEIYKQTIFFNSTYKDKIFEYGNMRYIDWERGGPYTFTIADFELLINSGRLFARKFDESTDFEIIDKIYHYLSGISLSNMENR